MRGFTEDELDIFLIVILALIAITAMMGWFPNLTGIFPSLMSGMFRVMDIIKNSIGVFKYI